MDKDDAWLDESYADFSDETWDETPEEPWDDFALDSLEESDLLEEDAAEYIWGEEDGLDLEPGSYPAEAMLPRPIAPTGTLIVMTALVICLFLAALSLGSLADLPTFPLPGAADFQEKIAQPAAEDQLLEETIVAPEDVAAECKVSSHFPQAILQWCGLITHYANRRDLAPDLVAALILQESGGNEVAISHSGAVGLMQVMPSDGTAATFMCINGPCFKDRPTTEQLKEPAYNIAYGTRLLANLVRRYGDLREALKSYGPMNVGYYYADKVLGLFQRYGAAAP